MTCNIGQSAFALVALTMITVCWSGDTKRKVDPKPPKKVVGEIEDCISKLGADSFKDRKWATRRLLEIGGFARPKNHVPFRPYRKHVLNRMRTLSKHADPEISQRAQGIAKALHPVRRVCPMANPRIGLRVHHVDRSVNTLEEIAEMYDTKVEWIMEANPAIKGKVDFDKVVEISIPVPDLVEE